MGSKRTRSPAAHGRWAALQRALARLRPGPRRDEITFFTALDLRFDKVLIELDPSLDEQTGDRRVNDIQQLVNVLEMRAAQRVDGVPPRALAPPVEATGFDVAQHWVRFARRSFGAEYADAGRLTRAFTRFANGALRVPYHDDAEPSPRGQWVLAEPDSGYFLLFAEFAALASAADPGATRNAAFEPDFFASVLPAAVAAQAIALDVYRPDGGWRSLLDRARWSGVPWAARRVRAHAERVRGLGSPAAWLAEHRSNLRRILRIENEAAGGNSRGAP
ncbi:MAG: hypothetical protein IPH13_10705 [Planctomycetes bacterium]|nr:hypothetical protein [Planctomycetota bacterium]MCC7172172.1 hypothetical protein [Planctomycetota bacterium]